MSSSLFTSNAGAQYDSSALATSPFEPVNHNSGKPEGTKIPTAATAGTTTGGLSFSRPRRTSSSTHSYNNGNGTNSASTASFPATTTTSQAGPTTSSNVPRSASTSRTRSRGYSNSLATASPTGIPGSIADEKRQSKFDRLFGTSGGNSPSSANGSFSHQQLSNTYNSNNNPYSGSLSSSPRSGPGSLGASRRTSHGHSTPRLSARHAAARDAAAAAAAASASVFAHTKPTKTQGREEYQDDSGADAVYSTSSGSAAGVNAHAGRARAAKSGGNSKRSTSKGSPAATISIPLPPLADDPIDSDSKNDLNTGEEAGGGGGGGGEKLLRCERCLKVYHHPQSLIKHRWQHTEMWNDASKYGMSKHQTVQALEAAVILANPDALRLLPNDKSHWPAAVSPATSGLLGSERLNIEILRRQAEVNERELAQQESRGALRPITGAGLNVPIGAHGIGHGNQRPGMQIYSKSMPANLGMGRRRRSGLAKSLHRDTMADDEENDNVEEQDDLVLDEEEENMDEESAMQTEGEEGGSETLNTLLDEEDDEDSTESEDEVSGNFSGYPGVTGTRPGAATSDLETMDQDMFSLDISSSSPYAGHQPLPPIPGGHVTHPPPPAASAARGGLSYTRKGYASRPSLNIPTEGYTFLPTIPSATSLHLPETQHAMHMRDDTDIEDHHAQSRSSRGFEDVRAAREQSSSSSTDEQSNTANAGQRVGGAGVNTGRKGYASASASGSGDDDLVSHATKDSGFYSSGHNVDADAATAAAALGGLKKKSEQGDEGNPVGDGLAYGMPVPSSFGSNIGASGQGNISASAPVLGFFTEATSSSGLLPTLGNSGRQHAIHGNHAPPFSPSIKPVHEGIAIAGYSPLEAQAAEILSTSHQSQQHLNHARSPPLSGVSSFRNKFQSPIQQLPSSRAASFANGNGMPSLGHAGGSLSQSPHPGTPSAQQQTAYSFGQAPLGSSYSVHTPFGQAAALPSPAVRPVDAHKGRNHNGGGQDMRADDDEDEIMDMDL